MDGDLGFVQRLWRIVVGKPGLKSGLVVGGHRRGVDEGALAVGGGDGQRGRVAVVDRVRADHGQTGPFPVPGMRGQPVRHRAGFQCTAADIEAFVHLGFDGGQRVEQPVAQHPELEIVEQPVDLVAVPRQQSQGIRGLGQRHVPHQMGQLPVQHDTGKIGAQRISDLAPDAVDVVHQTL